MQPLPRGLPRDCGRWEGDRGDDGRVGRRGHLGAGRTPAQPRQQEDGHQSPYHPPGRLRHLLPRRPLARIEVDDSDGAFRDLRLERPQDEVIVLRPDRYVAAVCRADRLDAVIGELCDRLRG